MHPEHLDRRFLLGGLAGAAGVSALAAIAKAGPLNPPPGAVTGSGKTTQEVYDRFPAYGLSRTEINAANTPPSASAAAVISEPGYYYLPSDFSGAGKTYAIQVIAVPAVIDLNGHTVSGASGRQLSCITPGATVRNGRIAVTVPGSTGVYLSQGCTAEDLLITVGSTVNATGIQVTQGRATGCTVLGGVSNGQSIDAIGSTVQRCAVYSGTLPLRGTDSTFEDCLVNEWATFAAQFTRCVVSRCVFNASSTLFGVQLFSRNVFRGNILSLPVAPSTVALHASDIGNIIEDNLVQGCQTGIRATAAYNIIRRNIVGGSSPKFDVVMGNGLAPTTLANSSTAFTGNDGYVGPLSSAHPDANLVF